MWWLRAWSVTCLSQTSELSDRLVVFNMEVKATSRPQLQLMAYTPDCHPLDLISDREILGKISPVRRFMASDMAD
jgi:hypothetical protein